MTQKPSQRIVLGASKVSIWGFPLLDDGAEAELRHFLARAFSLPEVQAVELDRGRWLGRVRHAVRGDLGSFWRRLGVSLRSGAPQDTSAAHGPDAADLFLRAPGPTRIRRIGDTLTTFRARVEAPDLVRIGHPLLRRRSDMRFRLAEELAALPGVREFRANPLTTDFTIRLDSNPRAAERLVRELERAWPRLLDGVDGPVSSRRLAASGGLLALSTAGTLAVPALLPVAVLGIIVYGAPNLVAAVRDLRRGKVGLPALAATGLVFFIATRSPLTSSLISTITQAWPVIARDRALVSQRRLLAPWRRRPRWAWRVLDDGAEVEVPVETLRPGDLVMLRRGDVAPVDGRIERGFVATAEAGGVAGEPVDRQAGDRLDAGAFVLDGEAALRVSRRASDSVAALIEARLPHGPFREMPSLEAARARAERNAKPALALAFYRLAITRTLRPSQGIIRPDYLTGPTLGAALSAEHGFVDALRSGTLFLRPAALDPLADADVFVLDDSAPLLERPIEIARATGAGVSRVELLSLATTAFAGSEAPLARTLRAASGLSVEASTAANGLPFRFRRKAGCLSYTEATGSLIEVASSSYLLRGGLGNAEARAKAEADLERARAAQSDTGAPMPLWVLRDRRPIGRIEFRLGPPRPARPALDRLRAARGPSLRVLLLSAGGKDETAALGTALGTDFAIGGLSPVEKAHVIRGLGRRAVWIGDGATPRSAPGIAASEVSLSTAAPSAAEQADGLLLGRGLDGVLAARAAARRRRAALAVDSRLVYGFNLAAAGGALAGLFGGFDTGLISNSGTAVILATHLRRLDALAREQDQRARILRRAFSA